MGSPTHGKPCLSTVRVVRPKNEQEVVSQCRMKRVTPLPMNQLFPMSFVLLNESICSTMLLPFVGFLVAHLTGVSVNEAGYYSGMLIGVFMLGKVVSAKMWGWLSDKYGRRFPLISGLFTSGLMMLGFGLSTSVWMCVFFRFLHGLFNGNVLVAKTMMSDLTDKTNAAKGFAFVSLCYGIGVLIGPTLGGVLYDPANSSALRWAHVTEESILSRRPALLPSIVLFIYTNIGMCVCTFFVMESNPKAERLPMFLRYIYPCFRREPRMFVRPPSGFDEQLEIPTVSINSEFTLSSSHNDDRNNMASVLSDELLLRSVSFTRAMASLTVASPFLHEDPRLDLLVIAESLSCATERPLAPKLRSAHSHRSLIRDDAEDHNVLCLSTAAGLSWLAPNIMTLDGTTKDRPGSSDNVGAPKDAPDGDDHLIVVETRSGGKGAMASSSVTDKTGATAPEQQANRDDVELDRFGYKQAFARPITRAMLLLYMLLCAADMATREIVPLWAIANVDKGGLGFAADKVSYILFANSFPCIASNLLFHKACSRYENKLELLRIAVMGCGVSITVLPLTSYFIRGGCVLPVVVLCTSVCQFFASWCNGLVTMLTAQSAPPQHVGSLMGINQSCGSSVRALLPFVVTPLFAWSITSGHSFPLDHVLIFFLSALTFASAYVYSTSLRTNEDATLVIVEHQCKALVEIRRFIRNTFQRRSGST
ncbi:hypothetical protein JKF63_01282 [Porcisia hertigi]|uniref:Uncharacterized protein n=1 Tax=Porcisia hertigi TaxID=2761500 RepID=A0A836H2Y5_9TRYP|nr:hypothetical protein JKF63_01282 [Porcisia hertigi]